MSILFVYFCANCTKLILFKEYSVTIFAFGNFTAGNTLLTGKRKLVAAFGTPTFVYIAQNGKNKLAAIFVVLFQNVFLYAFGKSFQFIFYGLGLLHFGFLIFFVDLGILLVLVLNGYGLFLHSLIFLVRILYRFNE